MTAGDDKARHAVDAQPMRAKVVGVHRVHLVRLAGSDRLPRRHPVRRPWRSPQQCCDRRYPGHRRNARRTSASTIASAWPKRAAKRTSRWASMLEGVRRMRSKRNRCPRSGRSRRLTNKGSRQLFLVKVEEIAGIYFESAGELKDIVETDVLFSAFHFAHKITVDLDHLAQLFLGQASFRAYSTQACAER